MDRNNLAAADVIIGSASVNGSRMWAYPSRENAAFPG